MAYKAPLPAATSLICSASLQSLEGRKAWVTAEVLDRPGGVLYATGKALFVIPKDQVSFCRMHATRRFLSWLLSAHVCGVCGQQSGINMFMQSEAAPLAHWPCPHVLSRLYMILFCRCCRPPRRRRARHSQLHMRMERQHLLGRQRLKQSWSGSALRPDPLLASHMAQG